MDQTAVFLGVVSGLVVNRVIEWLKLVPWLSDDEKSRITGPLADWLAWLLSIGTTYLLSVLVSLFGQSVSSTEMFYATGTAAVASKLWYEGQKFFRK